MELVDWGPRPGDSHALFLETKHKSRNSAYHAPCIAGTFYGSSRGTTIRLEKKTNYQ